MTQREMVNKLMELGYSGFYAAEALKITNFNMEEAKELLYLYTKSSMQLTYELLKLKKRVEKLEKLLENKSE